jgi:hypothetical protein
MLVKRFLSVGLQLFVGDLLSLLSIAKKSFDALKQRLFVLLIFVFWLRTILDVDYLAAVSSVHTFCTLILDLDCKSSHERLHRLAL